MTFDDWCATCGAYLNDNDDAARAARLMARLAWDAAVAAERERLCAAIKAADDKASEGYYMLDSDDCISVIRGTWNFTISA